jgi:sulfur relay (sulfurtransferase) complex TusBCD TusD component (DsrE family)
MLKNQYERRRDGKAAVSPIVKRTMGSQTCPMSTLADLYEIVKDSDRIVTF